MMQVEGIGPRMITLWVQSENSGISERRFDKKLTIPQLKSRLEPITGIPCDQQKINLYQDATLMGTIEGDDTIYLGTFPVSDWMTLSVSDRQPRASVRNQYTDVSLVEKFELSDDKYDQLQDSVREFKRRHGLGRFKSDTNSVEEAFPPSSLPQWQETIPLNQRCQVDLDDLGCKRGMVRYVGCPEFKPGVWVGIEYDEPVGRHSGTVQGTFYFAAREKHGAFVRPNRVQVGDFPELDLMDELEEF